MRLFALILTMTGICLAAFGVWGVYTPDGRARFDEMDGMYPLIAGGAGVICLAIGGAMLILIAWQGRHR